MSASLLKYSLLAFPLASAGLGVWQIKRRDWKLDLIANLERQLKEEPIDLLEINSAEEVGKLEYRRIKTRGNYDSDPSHQLYLKPRQLVVNEEALFRGRSAHNSNNGVNVVTPFSVEGTNLRILVNRGWLALKGRDALEENEHIGLKTEDGKPQELVGVLRSSDKRRTYGMGNDGTKREWHIRDIESMSKVLQTAPIFIDAAQDRDRTDGPYGGQTQLNVRNEHLNYAITWFSLSFFSLLMWYSLYGKRKILPRALKFRN